MWQEVFVHLAKHFAQLQLELPEFLKEHPGDRAAPNFLVSNFSYFLSHRKLIKLTPNYHKTIDLRFSF